MSTIAATPCDPTRSLHSLHLCVRTRGNRPGTMERCFCHFVASGVAGRGLGGIWGLKRRVRDHKSVDEHYTGDHGVRSSVLFGQPTFSTEKQHMISPKAVFVGRIACSANGQWRPSRFRALQSSPATTGAPMMVGVPCKSILYTC